MARKPRIHFPGAFYHVILTGLDQQGVFQSVADRRHWESLIADGVARFGYSVHAYFWAKTHAHIALQVKDVPLSKVMQNLTFRYTRQFNSNNDRQGPLFHGRYKAVLIDGDQYLNDLVRYIHNGPVREGLAKSASAGKWTSHAAYLGTAATPEWLTTAAVLDSFGNSEKVAQRAFEKFVKEGADEGVRTDLMRGSQEGRILGGERFARKALKPAKVVTRPVTLNQLAKRVCRIEGVKEAELVTDSRARVQSRVRQTITYLAMELDVASLTDMARRFNRDLTTMSRNQRYFRDRLTDDPAMQKHLKKLKKEVLVG